MILERGFINKIIPDEENALHATFSNFGGSHLFPHEGDALATEPYLRRRATQPASAPPMPRSTSDDGSGTAWNVRYTSLPTCSRPNEA